MSTMNMIPLREVPHYARAREANARREFVGSRASMVQTAEFQIEEAPGTYANTPKTIGWVLTRAAAQAISDQLCRMPGGTSHYLFACHQLQG